MFKRIRKTYAKDQVVNLGKLSVKIDSIKKKSLVGSDYYVIANISLDFNGKVTQSITTTTETTDASDPGITRIRLNDEAGLATNSFMRIRVTHE